MKRSVMLMTVVLAMGAASGCAAYHPCPFHVEKQVAHCPGTGKSAVEVHDKDYTLGFVEYDDQGWLWDPAQMEEVLTRVDEAAKGGGAVIVVYVPGWHHNAAESDDDVQSFHESLHKLNTALNKGPGLTRLKAVPGGKATVFGIFVGWRGASLPGFLDLLTFSERKRAAHRVGYGDVGELFIRLDNLHAQYQDRYTGLVVVGHSFGGAVVYSAISARLQNDLAARMGKAGAKPSAQDRLCLRKPERCVRAIGDLVVLVNPAFESSLYYSIDLLARTSDFDRCQMPVLLTVSSEADWPNRRFFPFGQAVLTQEQGVWRDSDQKHEVHTSLGNFRKQVTHCLKAVSGKDCDSIPQASNPALPEQGLGAPVDKAAAAISATTEHNDPCHQPLGAGGKFDTTVLYRVNDDPKVNSPVMAVNSPVILARATRELIPGHDLFDHDKNQAFIGFLVSFVHDVMREKFEQRQEARHGAASPAQSATMAPPPH